MGARKKRRKKNEEKGEKKEKTEKREGGGEWETTSLHLAEKVRADLRQPCGQTPSVPPDGALPSVTGGQGTTALRPPAPPPFHGHRPSSEPQGEGSTGLPGARGPAFPAARLTAAAAVMLLTGTHVRLVG